MNAATNNTTDITRTTLSVLTISLLIFASFWLARPFLTPFIWAGTIVIATWPILTALQSLLLGKRSLATAAMTLMLLMVFVVPLSLAVGTITERTDEILVWVKSLSSFTVPEPPRWLAGIPLFGAKLADNWQQLSALSPEELSARLAPYAGKSLKWFVSKVGGAGMIVFEFLITVIMAAILYSNGEKAAAAVRRFARRLGGPKGEAATVLGAQAIRGVALGVALTAIIQSVLGGIGLAVAGVPAATVLTAVMFILCVAQIGPGLVLIPSIILLYWSGDTLWGTLLLVWSVPVILLDNFLRPALIKKGADLPLLLIFAGVVGGLIAFGLIGLFIGPVILAVSYTLLVAWVSENGQSDGSTIDCNDKDQSAVEASDN